MPGILRVNGPVAIRIVACAALSLWSTAASAQTADNVLLVVNSNSPHSAQIADHYVSVRRIPERNIVRIATATSDMIDRPDYTATIENPIAVWLAQQQLQDEILYIVLTKGVPLRIDGTGGLSGTVASVDSELTLLYRRMVGTPVMLTGRIDNPYFLGDRPIGDARRFARSTSDLYLVTRLDGFTVEDVVKLIDRGANPVRDGQIVLDEKATTVDGIGDGWLKEAAERLTAMQWGASVQLEATRAQAAGASAVLGHYSWGSNDPANQQRTTGLRFADGAIGGMFVGTDGRTFREPGPAWRPGSTTGGPSLVGDLIREGITGVSGHVAEPYLDAIVRPQILFPAYVSGFNLAESFYLAMPYLNWQNIVIGDPLCSPFAQPPLEPGQISRGIDEETGLPAFLSERRLALLESSDLNITALKLSLKAMSLQAQGRPREEVDAIMAQAVALEPRLTKVDFDLAVAAGARGDFDDAIERYRAILAISPDNFVALNNLAFALADYQDGAKEALPLAERAYWLSGQAPLVADTLGWVHYKLGNLSAARLYVDKAATLAPQNLEILIHAAIVHDSLGNAAQARTYLDAAVKLDPKVAERADVRALVGKIQ